MRQFALHAFASPRYYSFLFWGSQRHGNRSCSRAKLSEPLSRADFSSGITAGRECGSPTPYFTDKVTRAVNLWFAQGTFRSCVCFRRRLSGNDFSDCSHGLLMDGQNFTISELIGNKRNSRTKLRIGRGQHTRKKRDTMRTKRV